MHARIYLTFNQWSFRLKSQLFESHSNLVSPKVLRLHHHWICQQSWKSCCTKLLVLCVSHFPNVNRKLKFVGHCFNKSSYENLDLNSRQIEVNSFKILQTLLMFFTWSMAMCTWEYSQVFLQQGFCLITTWISQICPDLNMLQTELSVVPNLDWHCLHSLPSRELKSFFTSILPFPYSISYQVLKIPSYHSFLPQLATFQILITPHLDNSKDLQNSLVSSLIVLYLVFTIQSELYKYFPLGWMKPMLHGKACKNPCHLSCLRPVTFIVLMSNNTEQVAFH